MGDSIKKVDTIVLGAGISGLTLGYYLHKKSSDFLVFESNGSIGGNISTTISNGFICENGPNTVLMNNMGTKKLISDLQLEDEVIYPNANNNKRFLIRNGKLIEIPQSLKQFFRSNFLSCRAKIRIIFEVFKKKTNSNTSVYEFFRRRLGKEFHDRIIEPFLTGIYAGNTRNMSIKHVLKKIWEMEQNHGSIILGFIKKKSRNEIPKSFNFKKGLRRLSDSIFQVIEKKIILNSKITSISKIGNSYEIMINKKIKYRCDKLVSTISAYDLSDIIFDKKLSQALKKVSYCPMLVLHLGLEKEKIQQDISGFGVLTKPADKRNFLGIIFNSQIFPHVAPIGKDLVTVMIGGARQEELLSLDKEFLFEKVIKDVRKLISYNGEIIMKHDFLWKRAIPQYQLNHEGIVSKIEDFQNKNKNFHITGNYYNGISVSDCIEKAYALSKIL